MASTYSTNLALELIGTGDQAGTWGVTTNTNLGTLLEQAISGYVTQAVSTGTDTTITIPNGSTGVARNMYIELTGTGGTNTNLIVPANKKLYFIFNNASGAVTVKVSGQTGVSVPTGKKMLLVSNGTDIVNGVNYIADFGTNSFTVTNLTATSATITNLIATTATVSDLSATVLRAASASITNLALTSLTISSLSITNVSVASATVSSNLTLSGGTANGVLYLNGSKVATSGSALVFTGTNLGIGNNATNARLEVTASTGEVFRADASGGAFRIVADQSDVKLQGTSSVQGWVNGSEGFRLTSTSLYTASGINVGIGTSSPNGILEASSSTPVITGSQSNTSVTADMLLGAFNAYSYDTTVNSKGGVGGIRVYSEATYNTGGTPSYLAFYTHANAANNNTLLGAVTERARIDSSGNLGLGVTPSAWSGFGKTMEFNNAGCYVGNSGATSMQVGANNYFNGSNYIYSTSNVATRYAQSSGQHLWFISTDPTPTAGNAISFTQAMTLTAAGDLCVGITSSLSAASNRQDITVNGASSSVFTLGVAGTRRGYLFTDGSDLTLSNEQNNALILRTNATERARITSGGNFGIANTDPNYNLSVGTPGSTAASYIQLGSTTTGTGSLFFGDTTGTGSGSYRGYVQYDHNTDALIFGSAATNRARISSGGEFLVNTANAAGTSGVGVALNPSDQGVRLVSASTTNSTETLSVYSTGATAYRFYVGWGGTVYATNTTISAISDQRFKENISDLDVGLDAVLALKPRKFDWKEGKGKDIKGDRGFIAQEFEQVFPDLVDEWRDPAPEGEEPYKSVRQDLIPVLVKAIQEQQAMIKSLEAKVAALESK